MIWKNIQALRAVAALMVVLAHAQAMNIIDAPIDFGRFGYSGVDIFFVISGFIICMVVEREPAPVFLARRLARIFPLYWLVLILAAILSNWVPMAEDWMRHDPPILHLLLLTRQNRYIAPAWTLCYELYFYAVAAGILLLAPRRFFPVLAGLVVAQAAVVFLVGGPNFFTSPLILEFGMGALAAYAAQKTALPFGRTALLLAAAGFVGGAMWTARWVQAHGALLPDLQRLACFGLGSFFLVYGLASIERNRGWVLGGLWQIGGAISYAVYLLHSPILKTARALLPEHNPVGWAAIALILGLAWLAHIAVERPAIAAARRLRRPQSEH